MSNPFVDSIQAAIDSKDYQVEFVVKVSARNAGEAIHRAADRLLEESTTVTVKDVKEV